MRVVAGAVFAAQACRVGPAASSSAGHPSQAFASVRGDEDLASIFLRRLDLGSPGQRFSCDLCSAGAILLEFGSQALNLG
jgi:hypothetical protein